MGMHIRYWYKKSDSVSTVIGILLVLCIVVSAISVVFLWGVPYMDQMN